VNFWGVVFVVLMCLWLFLGFYPMADRFSPVGTANVLIPWCCVAILGYHLFAPRRA
jgi:hypothetical protein